MGDCTSSLRCRELYFSPSAKVVGFVEISKALMPEFEGMRGLEESEQARGLESLLGGEIWLKAGTGLGDGVGEEAAADPTESSFKGDNLSTPRI